MPYVLTLVADRRATTLTHAQIERVRDAIGGSSASILSEGEAADVLCSTTPDLARVRIALEGARIDALFTHTRNRRRGLLVADMDSTIVTGETLDELAAFARVGEQVTAITRRSMNGEVDFADALRERAALLKGLDLAALEATFRTVVLTEGAKILVATMRNAGATTALVSGGFTFFTSRVAVLCGFDIHRANTLADDGSHLTGRLAEPILGPDTKRAILHELAEARGLRPRATLAVGDGANDLPMLREAGLAVAFRPKPVVAAEIPNQVRYADLRALLFVQGYSTEVFAAG